MLTPLRGAAIHINAYNFPVWGMLEKLAPALLSGMPAIVKPASATAWLAHAAFRILVEADLLPPGSIQLLLGPAGEIFSHLTGQDVVAFTGSAETGARLRAHPVVTSEAVRFSAEQDSLNASVLGPDAGAGSRELQLFVAEIVREMTIKAGQRCTAIRRALVPAELLNEVEAALAARLRAIPVGDPREPATVMGPLAGAEQKQSVLAKIEILRTEAKVVATGMWSPSHSALPPVLLRCDTPMEATHIHEVEAFGPVVVLMPYGDIDEALALARRGNGSLVLSLFSRDRDVVRRLMLETAAFHGRILIVDSDSAPHSTGHGSPLPHLVHGGPGRAGGGEELGGLIGMKHYMQRTAVQGSSAILDFLSGI